MKQIVRRMFKGFGSADPSTVTDQDRNDTLFGVPWLGDVSDAEKPALLAAKPFTMTSQARLLYLVRVVEYIVQYQIPGALVECGVWRGGSMVAAAKTLQRMGDTTRHLWLFDTYAGMTAPTELDRKVREQLDVQEKWEQSLRDGRSEWCFASLEDVRQNMASTGYPMENVHFVKGPVEETLPGFQPQPLAMLRLDTDWYESTRCELELLYPMVVKHGVVILDDYGSWDGARKAADEFISKLNVPILLSRVDGSARAWVKSDAAGPAH